MAGLLTGAGARWPGLENADVPRQAEPGTAARHHRDPLAAQDRLERLKKRGAETMSVITEGERRSGSPFILAFLGKVVLLALTIVLVWAIYAYLHVYRLDWLGWAYVQLQPLTNSLYSLVETTLPDNVKYQVRGAITDDLGQRSLFLLLLSAVIELVLYSFYRFLKALFSSALSGRA
jgi:hypothetical protein